MRITRRSASGPLATNADHGSVCRDSKHNHGAHHENARSLRIFLIVAIVMLTACSDSREPSIEVSEATVAQYENTCGLCHENGDGGAPMTGDAEDWKQRVAKGMNKVRDNAVEGFEGATGIMPAKGGYETLTDEEVIAITDYMVDISR